MKFTIFTPTYNRAHILGRVYKSIVNQTIKDFIWLIIDDGSTDNTKELVAKWQSEKEIEIDYYFKENGGKHTAMKLAYELAKTKYLLAIDSDDELIPDAVEVIKKEWVKIEEGGLENQFAEVSALTHSIDGKLIGNFYFPKGTEYIDSNWHEMVLKFKNNNEHIVCWNLEKLRECVNIVEKIWLSDTVSFSINISQGMLWARIGRKYKTRYLNKILRIYHFDGGDSIMRTQDKTKGFYNNLVGQKYFLDENLDHFFCNPKYFFNLILKFIISGIELRISPLRILKQIKSTRFKIAYLLCFPTGLTGWLYFKFIKRRFWF